MTEQKKIKFKYIGSGGEFHHGIPARDLTEDDWAALAEEQQAVVAASPLYKAEAEMKAKNDKKEEAE